MGWVWAYQIQIVEQGWTLGLAQNSVIAWPKAWPKAWPTNTLRLFSHTLFLLISMDHCLITFFLFLAIPIIAEALNTAFQHVDWEKWGRSEGMMLNQFFFIDFLIFDGPFCL